VSESDKVILQILEECQRKVIPLVLESLNENLEQLVAKLEHCSGTSRDQLQQYYREQQDGKERYRLRTLDNGINSMQFYDIIIQKLQHILSYNRQLLDELRSITNAGYRRGEDYLLIILPELFQLQEAMLQVVKEEFIAQIEQVESQFTEVTKEQVPDSAIDIELFYRKSEVRLKLDELLQAVPRWQQWDEAADDRAQEDRQTQMRQVVSLFTMNAERETFSRLFSRHPVMCQLESEITDGSDEPEDEIELF
jgi:hypothetical protein